MGVIRAMIGCSLRPAFHATASTYGFGPDLSIAGWIFMSSPPLVLYNTLDGGKSPFAPVDPAHIRIYACGPTVYNYAHVGNARMAVVFDLLVRLLRTLYPKVTYVSNITDVDDKIMAASLETGEKIDAITRRYERIYNDDMTALGVAAPDAQPRATDHIQDMINLIGALIRRGHAYAAENHVLFEVQSFPSYGRLSGRGRDDQIAGARVEIAPFKRDPADFVLWKPSSPDQPGWDSPWGRGRPGWHIECSAMAERHLGLPFDIHGGGADLKFPHHENEIAQSCCAHGQEIDLKYFARFWVHNGFVTTDGEKMSKSLGNIRLVHELLKHYDGEVLRVALLSAHYRQPLDWTEKALDSAKALLDSLYRRLYELRDGDFTPADQPPALFMEALCDDLNTPQAFAVLSAMAKQGDREGLLAAGKMLGILRRDPAQWLGFGQADDSETAHIEKLLRERQDAKKSKDFKRADEIRNQLSAQGIVIEDTPAGPQWRRA
jgi:cysteinyl-tRNA synthetase